MAKFAIILLLCALVAICSADDAKKEKTVIEELQTNIDARLAEIKAFISEHVDEAKLKEFGDKLTEHGKKFITDTQSDFEKLNAKKA